MLLDAWQSRCHDEVHPDQEQFVNDSAANALLDRPRRKGFELPVL